MPPVGGATAGVLAGDEPHEAHQRRGPPEAAPVAHLGLQGQAAHVGHAPVGAQTMDPVGKGLTIEPGDQVGLHRRELGVAGQHHRPVMPEGGRQRRLIERLGGQPRLVQMRPVGPAPPHPPVTQQELGQPVAGPGQVLDHVAPGAAQVPHRFLEPARHPDGHQLSGPVQAGQAPAVAAVGLDLVARRPRDQRRGHHVATHAQRPQQPVQVIARRPRLIAGPQQAGLGEPGHQAPDRLLVVEDLLDVGALMARVQDPDRDRVLVHVHAEMDCVRVGKTGHGRLLPYVGSARNGGRSTQMRTEPAVPS